MRRSGALRRSNGQTGDFDVQSRHFQSQFAARRSRSRCDRWCVTFSASAGAGPLPLFPFVMAPPVQTAPQPQAAPSQDEGPTELPARLKRQVVSYATREAPGTIIIDTPNTYLYLVLRNGRAVRYGIGVGRDGFTWSGVQSITKKAEWPDWTPPAEMIARQPYLPRYMAGGPGNPLGAARHVLAVPSIASTAPTLLAPSARVSRQVASASPTGTLPTFIRG